MDKAKAAISDFMHKAGHHNTTVHETVAPSVQHETVKPHQHENVTTAVDKEVHQDHYHRTVQPVQDREVLPEKHSHNLNAVQHREFDHRDHDTTQRTLADDQAGFKDHRVVADTTHSQSAAPTVGGEHVHHHIHETIQPVVHKETIQPNVVHTTVPIHEVHHNSAKHHDTTNLPAMSMAGFKERGGVLGGREERYDSFEGQPKHIGGSLQGFKNKHDSAHIDEGTLNKSQHGDYPPVDGKHHPHGPNVAGTGRHTGIDGSNATTGRHTGTDGRIGETHNTTGTTGKKPSLLDRVNPLKDTDGDGKRGFND